MASSLAMSKRRVPAALAGAAIAAPAVPEEVTRRVGRLVVSAGESSAYPGGLVSVRLRSGLRYGAVHAILEGRRCPFLLSHRGLRALVPGPVDGQPGPTPLGIEVLAGRGRQRFALPITVAERSYPARSVLLPEVKKAMLTLPGGVRDGRLVQLYLRTVSAKQEWQGALPPPPAAAPDASFRLPPNYDPPAPAAAQTGAPLGGWHPSLRHTAHPGT